MTFSQDRINALPGLQKHAGAVYTLHLLATKALSQATGDASAVNWDKVHQDVFAKAVRQDGQPVAQVLQAIKTHSPGAVTSKQLAAVDALDNARKMANESYRRIVIDRDEGSAEGGLCSGTFNGLSD